MDIVPAALPVMGPSFARSPLSREYGLGTMLIAPPTPATLTATFNRLLSEAVNGSLCEPRCLGLDEATAAALDAIAVDRRHRATNIMAARRAFAAQLATMTPRN